jgi:hypothetical protein
MTGISCSERIVCGGDGNIRESVLTKIHISYAVNGTGNPWVLLAIPVLTLPLPTTCMGFPMKTSPRSSKTERY